MRHLLTTIVFCLSFGGLPAIAGPGHDHDHGHAHGPVSSEVAAQKAMNKLDQLAKAKKIDASWQGLKPASIEQKTYSQGPEWVVTFKNKNVSDESKQTLYLFYTLEGRYLAANYTGN